MGNSLSYPETRIASFVLDAVIALSILFLGPEIVRSCARGADHWFLETCDEGGRDGAVVKRLETTSLDI